MEEVVRYWEQSYGINPVALLFSIVITTVGMFAYVWWTTRPATHKEVRPEMLVLSFRAGDKVYIGEGDSACVVTVIKLGPNSMKLGLEADRDLCPVKRAKVVEREKEVESAPVGSPPCEE